MTDVRYRLEYSAKSIPLHQVIESLQAQQRLIPEALSALSFLAPGSELSLQGIIVEEIKSGSLIIDLLLQLYSIYQHSIDGRVVHGIEALTGERVPKEYEALVTLATFAVAYFVARWAYDAVRKKHPEKPSPTTHIEGDYNVVINMIADRLELSKETVDAAVGRALPPTKVRQLTKSVADFIRPAKQEPGSTLEGGNFSTSAEALAEFPSDLDLKDLDESYILDLPGALIEIRATDKDRNKNGWAAKVLGRPDFTERRLPMNLYPTIDAERLAVMGRIRGDLAVEMFKAPNGEFKPRRLHLLTVLEP